MDSGDPVPSPGDDLSRWPATALASAIRARSVSPVEIVDAVLARIQAQNPRINAFCTVTADAARRRAQHAAEALVHGADVGPLHGIPYSLKDLTDTAGVRTTMGSLLFADRVPTEDAPIVTRMRAAGAITLGKTNTPEFGAGSHTFNRVYGVTQNPWGLGRSAGGSSGGAAVGLACRMLATADGSDTGGSLRNPAAWNNVVGFRPTVRVVPSVSPGNAWMPISTPTKFTCTTASTSSNGWSAKGPPRPIPALL